VVEGLSGCLGDRRLVTPPSRGIAELNAAAGAFLYMPHATIHGADSFTFSSLDGGSRSPILDAVEDGELNIVCTPKVNRAKVSAILIVTLY